MAKTENQRDEVDDAFDQIFMAEDRLYEEGYAAGQREGVQKSYDTGYSLGVDKGLELTDEFGFYAGVLQELRKSDLPTQNTRSVVVMDKLESLIDEYFSWDAGNLTDEKFAELCGKIRSKFRQLMSLAKLDINYNKHTEPSF